MATVWRSYNNRARMGINASVTGSGNSRTITATYYLQMDQYASTSGSSTVTLSGFIEGNLNQNISLGPGATKNLGTRSRTVNLTDSTQSIVLGVTATHFGGGGGQVTTGYSPALSVSLPAKAPSAPTGLSITRISDSSHRLNWTRGSTYTAVVVQRRVNGGAWSQVGRPTGNAATYTDNTTSVNNKYEYRVAGVSAGGQSGWSGIATVYTTPAAVGAVTAVKAGTGIEVTATGLPPHATAYEVSDNGALLDGNVTSWPYTHIAPDPAVTHTYTVVAKRGTLKSAGRVSNTVQLQAAPLAPTGLSPNGAVSASDLDTVFAWVHNPVDTTAQTAYELRYRLVGGAWTTLTGTTAVSRAVSLAEGSFEWQVRTKGDFPEFGPWSAIATVGVVTRPGVAVQGAGSWDSPIYRAVWTFLQAQGRPQSSWQAELLDSEGTRVSGGFVEGTGAATAVTFPARLTDGSTYTVRVRAATGTVWSAWAPLEITVRFVLPAPVTMTGDWEERSGTVELALTDGRGPTRDDVVNLFTNPNLVGDGTWAEVRRNRVLNPGPENIVSVIASAGYAQSFKDGWRRIELTGTQTSSAQPRVQETTAAKSVPVIPGEPYFLRMEVRNSLGTPMEVRPYFLDDGGTYVTYTVHHVSGLVPGEGRVVEATGTTPAGAALMGYQIIWPSDVTNVNDGDWVEFRHVSDSPGPYFDGSTTPETAIGVVQPEDFRWRWLGTPNESESVMEIEQVRGLVGFFSIAGVSTREGKPAVRHISLETNASVPASRLHLPFAGDALSSGTVLSTLHLDEPLSGVLSGSSRRVNVLSPLSVGSQAPNLPGSYVMRRTYAGLTSNYLAQLWHGGLVGSPDVWWTDIGLFAGDYDGPAFAGDTGIVKIDGSAMSTSWEDEPNNSPSRATMAVLPDEVTVERSVQAGVWEIVDEFPFTGEDALTDRESLSNGVTQYRVTATVTATGAASVTLHDVLADSPAIWLSGGEAFADTARLPYNPAVQIGAGRQRTAKRYSGRPKPVIYSGEAVERAVQFGGSILMDDTDVAGLDTLERIAQAEYPLHQYRDPDGRRIFGMLGPISTTREAFSYWSYSASLEESER